MHDLLLHTALPHASQLHSSLLYAMLAYSPRARASLQHALRLDASLRMIRCCVIYTFMPRYPMLCCFILHCSIRHWRIQHEPVLH
jgi:hypothetical protein